MSTKRKLTVPGSYINIRQLCAFVSKGAVEAGLNEDTVFHIELCCDEACTNVIEHAYGAEDQGVIIVSYEYDDDSFTIVIEDNGHAFDPKQIPAPPVAKREAPPENVDDLRVGGLGIYFIKKLMDEVSFRFDENIGNTLVMVKRIAGGD